MMKKLLMLTHSAGYEHDYLRTAEEAVTEIGAASGEFLATTTQDCSLIHEENLNQYDALLFATTGELPMSEAQKQALVDFVKSGGAFIGVHNATDTLYKFPEYGEMIGGYFAGHPWTQEIVAVVEDGDHPSTRHLDPSFRVFDEIYTHRNWSREKTHVLIRLDNASVDVGKGDRKDQDYALAWCHPYGAGRVFYTAFGHPKELWAQAWFRKHLLGGIGWAMRGDR
ncbi:MAG: ThuA domain-containing protein [Candidatus Latescibacterota bacterium]